MGQSLLLQALAPFQVNKVVEGGHVAPTVPIQCWTKEGQLVVLILPNQLKYRPIPNEVGGYKS